MSSDISNKTSRAAGVVRKPGLRHEIDPGRTRAMALTLQKFNGGLSDDESAELAALNAQVVQ